LVLLLVALTLLASQMATIVAVPLTLAEVGVQMEELPLGKSGHWGLNMHTQRTTVVSVASQLQHQIKCGLERGGERGREEERERGEEGILGEGEISLRLHQLRPLHQHALQLGNVC